MKHVFFLIVAISCQLGFGGDHESLSFEVKNKKTNKSRQINAIITAENWTHITQGQQEENRFLGGHDWGYYLPKFIENNADACAYFDTNMLAYIVHSDKGLSLPDIIKSLQQRDVAHFHSLFPPGVLTKDFVLRAFKTAITMHTPKNKHIDFEQNSFYVKINDFYVAGHFYQRGNDYYITTCFPDLKWFYIIDFKHRSQEQFGLDRFIKYQPSEKIWIQHGSSLSRILTENDYYPQPIRHISSALHEDTQQVSIDNFLFFDETAQSFSTKFFAHGNEVQFEQDVLGFFFANSDSPTDKESADFIRTIRFFFPDLRINIPSNIQNKRKINLIKFALSKEMKKGLNFKKFHLNDQLNVAYNYHQIHSLKQGGLHFGIQILYTMLSLYTVSHINPPSTNDIKWLYDTSNNYHNNLAIYLGEEYFLSKMKEQKLVLDFAKLEKGRGNFSYTLSLRSIENISLDTFLTKERPYRMLFGIEGILDRAYDLSLWRID